MSAPLSAEQRERIRSHFAGERELDTAHRMPVLEMERRQYGKQSYAQWKLATSLRCTCGFIGLFEWR
jgi:hypothetical protein